MTRTTRHHHACSPCMQVSLFSARALPEGVDVKIVADAVTDAQKVVLSHRGPLPLRLQRLLAPGAKPTGVRGGTMFAAPQDRRLAHVAVPEVRPPTSGAVFRFDVGVHLLLCMHCGVVALAVPPATPTASYRPLRRRPWPKHTQSREHPSHRRRFMRLMHVPPSEPRCR